MPRPRCQCELKERHFSVFNLFVARCLMAVIIESSRLSLRSTGSCTVAVLTFPHERTLAGRPGSQRIISSHLISMDSDEGSPIRPCESEGTPPEFNTELSSPNLVSLETLSVLGRVFTDSRFMALLPGAPKKPHITSCTCACPSLHLSHLSRVVFTLGAVGTRWTCAAPSTIHRREPVSSHTQLHN